MSRTAGRRPRLGFYIPGDGPGGPSRYVDAILAGLDAAEFEVTVFGHPAGPYRGRGGLRLVPTEPGPGEPAGSIPEPAAGPGPIGPPDRGRRPGPAARVKQLVPRDLKIWAGFAREAARLAAIFRAHPVDLLHSQQAGFEEAPVAARLAGVPRVLGTFHVDSTYDLDGRRGGPGYRFLEQLSNRSLHRAIAVSAATKADWVGRTDLPPGRVVAIHNGVDLGHFAPGGDRGAARRGLGLPNDGRLLIGGVGRLEPAKGFAHLVRALATLRDSRPRVDLALAGRGPLRDELGALAGELGIGDRVHFLGFCPDARRVYESSDVFCLPSECEALPYALLEAMAAGLPAVAARVGGVGEMVDHGATGYLVPRRDPAALATALRPLLEDAGLRERMGRAARRRAEDHFDQAACVARTIGVYREMLGDGGRRLDG